jgi:hypothetical protein
MISSATCVQITSMSLHPYRSDTQEKFITEQSFNLLISFYGRKLIPLLYNCYILFLSQSKMSWNLQDKNVGKLMLQIMGYKKIITTCLFFRVVTKRSQSRNSAPVRNKLKANWICIHNTFSSFRLRN